MQPTNFVWGNAGVSLSVLRTQRNSGCYRLAFLSVVGYNHFLCRPLVSFVECFFVWLVSRVFYFFLKRWKFFKNNFSFGSALQALLKTLDVCWLVRFLIVLANCVGFSFGKCSKCFNLKHIFVLY